MKLTTLANTALAVIAIALTAASSTTPDLDAQTLETASPATHHTILVKRPGKATP